MFRPSLSLRFLLHFTLAFSVIATASLYFLLQYYSSHEANQLTARIGSQIGKLASGIDLELVSEDPARLRLVLKAGMTDPALVCMDIYAQGKKMGAVSQPRNLGCDVVRPERSITIDLLKVEGHQLKVGFSQEGLRTREREAFQFMSVFFAIMITVVSILIIVCFRFSVGRPVKALLRSIESLEDGEFSKVKVERQDEIGRLCNSFNQMGEKLVSQQEALREAVLEAEAADVAKSEFLANMSHEIRTPMNGVLGMAELLERSDLNAKQKQFTSIILRSGNALLQIINDILDFSKLDSGQMTIEKIPFSLHETIHDVVQLLSPKAEEKQLALRVNIQDTLQDKVLGDGMRLRQVITNLLGNAIKFTEKGSVILNVVSVPGSSSTTTRFAFSVQDTGIGIPKADLHKLFKKFSQADNSTTRRFGGTGLGLSISKSLVELMGGEIGCESCEGTGSTFWFELEMENGERAEQPTVIEMRAAS